MSTSPPLSVLRTRAQQRADMVNSQYVTDAEWTTYINNAGAELFDMIVQGDPLSLSITTDISVTPATQIYALPSNFSKLQAAYWMDADKPTFNLRRASMHEFGYQQGVEIVFVTGRPYAYNIVANNIWLFPLPNINGKVRVIYYPDYTPLSAESDTFSWPVQLSWVEFIDVTAAIAALTKEESDTQQLQLRKMEISERIRKSVATKDEFQAITSRDRFGHTARFRRMRLQV